MSLQGRTLQIACLIRVELHSLEYVTVEQFLGVIQVPDFSKQEWWS